MLRPSSPLKGRPEEALKELRHPVRSMRAGAFRGGVVKTPPLRHCGEVPSGSAVRFLGRDEECARIDALIDRVHAHAGRQPSWRGGPGVGKTALLGYAAKRGRSAVVLRATGRQSELEFAYAAMLELLWPEADRVPDLPKPPADVLRAALGIRGRTAGAFNAYAATLAFLALVTEDIRISCSSTTCSGSITRPSRPSCSPRGVWSRTRWE